MASLNSSLRIGLAIAAAAATVLVGQDADVPASESRPEAELAARLDPDACRIGTKVADLAFADLEGQPGRLSDFADRAALVVVVRDVGCPVSKRYGERIAALEQRFAPRNVAFLYVNTGKQDSVEECRAEAELYGFRGRYAREHEGRFGWHLGIRTTTDVFVLDADRRLRYRGAVDDQIGRGVTKPAITRDLLVDALEAVLKHERVAAPATTAPGCALRFDDEPRPEPAPPALTWHGRISRIIQAKCQACHRAGGAAGFPLVLLEDVEGYEAMIRQVVTDRVMPPWFASEDSGPFTNDTRLSPEERLDLLKWLQGGCAAGDPAEAPAPIAWPTDWRIGTPDVVVELPRDVSIPASGVLDYVVVDADVPLAEDAWVQAIEIRPTRPEVVHHAIVHVSDPDRPDAWDFFESLVPGKAPTIHPPGYASRIKKGAKLRFNLHYTPNGKACKDRTQVGIRLAREAPDHKVRGSLVREYDFTIPPGDAHFEVVSEKRLLQECDLRRFIPHMHLRGKSARVEILLPDGRKVVPLTIPRWHPEWQFAYELVEPLHVPADTVVRVISVFDNSKQNPRNPNAAKAVNQGPQIWDEMAGAYVEWSRPRTEKGNDGAGEEGASGDGRERSGND